MNATDAYGTKNDDQYFWQTVGLVVALYIATLLFVVLALMFCTSRDYIRDPSRGYNIPLRVVEGDNRGSRCCTIRDPHVQLTEFFSGTIFESTYVSYRGLYWSYSLLATRVLSFCFFFPIPLVLVFIREKGHNWIYFTFWNIELIVLYFLLASVASIIGISKKPGVCVELSDENYQSYNWTKAEVFLGVSVQILYVVAAPSSLLVTAGAYSVLSPQQELIALSFHLANLIAFVIELFLNSIVVRFEHLILFFSWLLLYVLYAWGMVFSGALTQWTYSQFKTNNIYSLAWYTVFFICGCITYLIWYLLSKLKFYMRGTHATSLLSLRTPDVASRVYSGNQDLRSSFVLVI